MKKFLLASALLLVSLQVYGLEVPALTGRVNDYGNILSAEEVAILENYLASVENSTTAQLVLLTIPSLEGDSLEDFSMRVAEAWKIGQKDKDNGLIMVVALADRKIRLEVGYGLEPILPDGKCGTIIRQVIIPEFRGGNYYQGISKGFHVIGDVIAGDETQVQELEDKKTSGFPVSLIIFGILIFVILSLIIGKLGPGTGRWTSGSSRGGWSSGSSWGRSGGGGGGFSGGGGSFGGGGASGSW